MQHPCSIKNSVFLTCASWAPIAKILGLKRASLSPLSPVDLSILVRGCTLKTLLVDSGERGHLQKRDSAERLGRARKKKTAAEHDGTASQSSRSRRQCARGLLLRATGRRRQRQSTTGRAASQSSLMHLGRSLALEHLRAVVLRQFCLVGKESVRRLVFLFLAGNKMRRLSVVRRD